MNSSEEFLGDAEQATSLMSEEPVIENTGRPSSRQRFVRIGAAVVAAFMVGAYIALVFSSKSTSGHVGKVFDALQQKYTNVQYCRGNHLQVCTNECFPGEAIAHVRELGHIPMASVRLGDEVLVENNLGYLSYEPVLGFLHVVQGGQDLHEYIAVEHEGGRFRATENHVVFVKNDRGERVSKTVSSLKVGDQFFATSADVSGAIVATTVMQVRAESTDTGMYAPLTMSGTIVVDGIVASNYANAHGMDVPHAAMQALFFPLRLYHKLGFAGLFAPLSSTTTEKSQLHPFVIPFMNLFAPSSS